MSRLETPGLAAVSNRTSPSLSVVADLIFFAIAADSSSIQSTPFSFVADLLIFAPGSCRSKIFAVSFWMTGSGTHEGLVRTAR